MIKFALVLFISISLNGAVTQSVYISVHRLKSLQSVTKINYNNYENLYLFHPNKLSVKDLQNPLKPLI